MASCDIKVDAGQNQTVVLYDVKFDVVQNRNCRKPHLTPDSSSTACASRWVGDPQGWSPWSVRRERWVRRGLALSSALLRCLASLRVRTLADCSARACRAVQTGWLDNLGVVTARSHVVHRAGLELGGRGWGSPSGCCPALHPGPGTGLLGPVFDAVDPSLPREDVADAGATGAPGVPGVPGVSGGRAGVPGGLAPALAVAVPGSAALPVPTAPENPEVHQLACSAAERKKYEDTRKKLAEKDAERRRAAAKGRAKAKAKANPVALAEGQAEAEALDDMGPEVEEPPAAPKPKGKKCATGWQKKLKAKEKAEAAASAPPGSVPSPNRGGRVKKPRAARPPRSRVSLPCGQSVPHEESDPDEMVGHALEQDGGDGDDPDVTAPVVPGASGVPGVPGVPLDPGAEGDVAEQVTRAVRRPAGSVNCFAGRYPPTTGGIAQDQFDKTQVAYYHILPEGMKGNDALQRSCWRYVKDYLNKRMIPNGPVPDVEANLEAAKEWATADPLVRAEAEKQRKQKAAQSRAEAARAASSSRGAMKRPAAQRLPREPRAQPPAPGVEAAPGPGVPGVEAAPAAGGDGALEARQVRSPGPETCSPGSPEICLQAAPVQAALSETTVRDDADGHAPEPSASSQAGPRPVEEAGGWAEPDAKMKEPDEEGKEAADVEEPWDDDDQEEGEEEADAEADEILT